MQNLKPILLVEDDTVDAMIVTRIFGELKVKNQMVHVVDGEEALKYLMARENKKPCVILLDLNMPRMNGIEFLKVIKADDELKGIPVIVLTMSREDQDKIDSFKLGVAGYILKNIDYKKFARIVEVMDMYWTLSELPGGVVKAR